MCLIHTGPSAQVRDTLLNTKGMIADIYQSNSDGLGVMYKNKRGLRIIKTVPKTIADVVHIIEQLPQDNRQLAMHWRMKTHGHVDLENCHPYVVVPGQVAMMHNGVLATGNDADKSKSDTWHFIRDYLAGPMHLSKELAHSPEFIELLAEYIGDNRFVFMDDEGRMSIVNRDSGIDHDGMWFSNAYAWTPSMLIPGYRSAYRGRWESDDWSDYYTARYGAPRQGQDSYTGSREICVPAATGTVTALTHYNKRSAGYGEGEDGWGTTMEADFIDAVTYGDAEDAAKILAKYPFSAIDALEDAYEPTLTDAIVKGGQDTLSLREQEILEAVFDGRLNFKAHSLPLTTADVICYYVNWTPRTTDPLDDPEVPDEAEEDDSYGDDDGREFRYAGMTVRMFFDHHATVWGYSTFDGHLSEVDSGFGYETAQEAMKWATDAIDAVVDKELMAWAH